jgi:hypothetical protein
MDNNPFDFKAIACKVYSVLTEVSETRDDDRLLLAHIWIKEVGNEKGNLKEFFEQFLSGKLSNPETVTRIRRKLQEQHTSLRGEKWEIRHNMEGEVCQQLTFFDKW